MYVNKMTFLAVTATLAAAGAGAAGGYLYRSGHGAPVTALPPEVPPTVSAAPPAAIPPSAAPSAVAVIKEPLAPACDDSVGVAADCPVTISSEDEGICKAGIFWAGKRCAEYKAAFKPKVAAAAVQCLRGLKGAETCDQNRANLCGHQALMLACQETIPQSQATVSSSNLSGAPPLPEGASPLALQCQEIVKSCSSGFAGATFADCYRTLSGMTDAGRSFTAECMKTHCTDKGFVGCEAATTLKTALLQ
jgi:hypothetical protein